jgi:hypothetical protein
MPIRKQRKPTQHIINPIARWSSAEIFIAVAIKYSSDRKIQVRSVR